MAIYRLGDQVPDIHPTAYIHPSATIIGNVTIGEDSSVWPNAVLRGDDGYIRVGARTSIQDNVVLHTTEEIPTTVGDDCIVGHLAHLEGCTIENGALIGANSTVMPGAIVRSEAVVGSNALVPGGMEVAGACDGPGRSCQAASRRRRSRCADHSGQGQLCRARSAISSRARTDRVTEPQRGIGTTGPPITFGSGSPLPRIGPPPGTAELDLNKKRTGAGWRLLRQAISDHRGGIALGMAISLLWTIAKVTVPLLIREGINDGIRGNGSLLFWSISVALVGTVSATCTGLRRYVAFRNARAVEAELRDRVYRHSQRLHFAFHDRYQTGQLMSRGNTDLQQFQNFITMLPVTFANLMTVLIAGAVLFYLNWGLAVLALGGLPLANYFGRKFAKRLHPAVMGIQEESAQLATVVEETIAGIRVVKGFGAEQTRADALSREADDVFARSVEAATARATFLPALELVPNIGLIAVLGIRRPSGTQRQHERWRVGAVQHLRCPTDSALAHARDDGCQLSAGIGGG